MASPIILPSAQLTDVQQDCVDKIREVLEQAEAGRVYTVGIVVCMETGFATTIGGNDAGSLNLGLDVMKARILERVSEDPVKRIVRARG